jgi:hypothetical protein
MLALTDGHVTHVRFRDAARARGEYDDALRTPSRVYDDTGALVAARPGHISTAASQRIRWEAYCDSVAELSDAWRKAERCRDAVLAIRAARPHSSRGAR